MPPRRHFWFVALSLSGVLGCQPPSEVEQLSSMVIGDPIEQPPEDPSYEEQQGTHALGFRLTNPVIGFDRTSLKRADGMPLPNPKVVDGTLMAPDNSNLVNATIKALTVDSTGQEHTQAMRIDAIEKSTTTSGRQITYYTLQILRRVGSQSFWSDVCTSTPFQPSGKGVENVRVGDSRAVLVPGTFGTDGFYSNEGFSFACVSGVAAKCDLWGFYPEGTTSGRNSADQPVTVNNSDLYAACMRMARADYCGTGISHTREGTQIVLWDDLLHFDRMTVRPISPHPVPPVDGVPGFYFEAAWAPDSMQAEFHAGGALCLDKLRYASIPVGGECGLKLRDPAGHGKVCETSSGAIPVGSDNRPTKAGLAQLEQAGALLFNLSRYEVVGLATWGTGRAYLTTSKLVEEPAGVPPSLWPGFTAPAGVTLPPAHAVFEDSEGNIFNGQLPQPPGTIPLYSYLSDDGDYRTTTEATVTGTLKSTLPYRLIALEGYIYPPTTTPSPDLAPLVLWWSTSENRSVTTTGRPGVEGWTSVRTEGYVMR